MQDQQIKRPLKEIRLRRCFSVQRLCSLDGQWEHGNECPHRLSREACLQKRAANSAVPLMWVRRCARRCQGLRQFGLAVETKYQQAWLLRCGQTAAHARTCCAT